MHNVSTPVSTAQSNPAQPPILTEAPIKHYKAIDGLRAYMAWWVVCQHMLQISGVTRIYDNLFLKLLTMGGLAVMVFIIISGFVITHLLILGRESYGKYITRRFFRLYPLYIVAILLALLLRDQYHAVVSQVPWADPGSEQRFLIEQDSLPLHVMLHALLLHGIVPDSILPYSAIAILAPAWSLSLEWQFYLIAPLLVTTLFLRGLKVQILAVAFCLGCMVAAYSANFPQQWVYPAFLPLAIGFFVTGILTRFLMNGTARSVLILPALLALANFVLFGLAYDYGSLALAFVPLVIWAVVAAYCWRRNVGATSAIERLLAFVLERPAAVNLGLWSYSTYLLHVPVFVATLAVVGALGFALSPLAAFGVVLATCPVIVALSWLSYRYLETPANQAWRGVSARIFKQEPAR